MASEVSEAVAAMILERRATREAAYATRTTTLARIRRTLTERRTAGLKQRHTAKLARGPKPEMLA